MESILPNVVGRAAFIAVITVLTTLRLLLLLLTTTVRSLCLVSAAVPISTQINLPPSFRAMRTITEKVTAACPTYDHVIVDIQGGRKVGNSDDEVWFCIYIHSPQALKCTL